MSHPDSIPAGHQLLFFQIGPVQEFITQARSTRDLWSGSYLITWMATQVVAAVRAAAADAEFIFPAIPAGAATGNTGLPTLDWIEGTRPVNDAKAVRKALLPAVPNRLVAVVPKEFDVQAVIDKVFNYGNEKSVWRRIAHECKKMLEHGGRMDEGLWDAQLRDFWQVTWLLTEANGNDDEVKRVFEASPIGKWVAGQKWHNRVDPWMTAYHAGNLKFDARRQVRDFGAVITTSWREKLTVAANEAGKDSPLRTLSHLFRGKDELAAPNAIKRVWHRAYLKEQQGFDKQSTPGIGDTFFNIPSIPGLCAYEWATKARMDAAAGAVMEAFINALKGIAPYTAMTLPKRGSKETDAEWLKRVDAEVYQESYWRGEEKDALSETHATAATTGAAALKALLKAVEDGAPETYYAVVAMDADGMGKRLSGENLGQSLTKKFHRDLSAQLALATIGEDNSVDPMIVVEDPDQEVGDPGKKPKFALCGKVIYAGADDFLVVVPATQALLAAQTLQEVFLKVMEKLPGQYPDADKFTISAGIAIGHMKEPLQDVTAVALERLKHAKRKLGSNTVAVQLFKRSGEQIQWAAGYDSPAWELLKTFQAGYRPQKTTPGVKPPISGRFPHRLAEVLRPYSWQPKDRTKADGAFGHDPAMVTAGLSEAVLAEFRHVAHQQSAKGYDGTALIAQAAEYLRALEQRQRTLPEFINLFLTEAFIARQGT
jgi:CRISPR-associated protein Cmr2